MFAGGTRHELPDPSCSQHRIRSNRRNLPPPRAQLDRFMFNIRISYSDATEECEIGSGRHPPKPTMSNRSSTDPGCPSTSRS